ncbi:DUF262 domain-containing protein [Pectobacterium versatile]|uniref:DUF262 domain-containing protein n=1 Tax=Pectobacterium versatile TaxID=2488639 RepID=UPI001F3AAFEB|nr:DUF262 domain-containing protein [Pectobacterium versatile]
MSEFDSIEELAGEGIYSGVELEDETPPDEGNEKEPFDTDSISITPKTVALDTVLRRIKNKTIRLAPDFQRNYVWDKKRKSQLIESMMLRIPLPMFYVSEDKNGVWEVVDGLQRLSTIKDFILGPDFDGKGFKLSGLEFWNTPYDGYDYFKLEKNDEHIKIVNNIMETELSFIIINPETPEKVKRNIFKRINTGGMRLSNQEIRHALYQGRASELLKSLVEDPVYLKVIENTVKDDRMAGRELILRFLAFRFLGYNNYSGDMDDFLSKTMKYINGEVLEDIFLKELPSNGKIIGDFQKGLERAYEIFGEHAFRKSLPGDVRKTPINKSLFELWLFCLTGAKEDSFKKITTNKALLLEKYSDLLRNTDFMNSISRHGASLQGAKARKDKLVSLLKEVRDAK